MILKLFGLVLLGTFGAFAIVLVQQDAALAAVIPLVAGLGILAIHSS